MQNNYRDNAILAAALGLLCAGLFWFGVRPSINNFKQLNRTVSEQKNKIQQLLKRGQTVAANQKNLELVENRIEALNRSILSRGAELSFIESLENAAADNQLEQTINFDGQAETKLAGLETVPLTLQLQGRLENILSYLNALEMMDYYINIDKLEISTAAAKSTQKFSAPTAPESSADSAPESALTVKIDAKTYWK